MSAHADEGGTGPAPPPLRVAIDATPLLGHRTGVGVFTAEVLTELAVRTDVEPFAYALSLRGHRRLASFVPPGVRTTRRPMAARPLRYAWSRWTRPPLEMWLGALDVAHGTNFVAPATRAAVVVVTVHDLTPVRFPELCTDDTRRYPALITTALERGAHVHAVSEFVAREVVELLGAPPEQVTAIPNGIRPAAPGRPRRGQLLVGSERYIVAIGTVEPRKNIPSLVRAFGQLAEEDPELRLAHVGAPGWSSAEVDRAVASCRHRDRISWLGAADATTLRDVLAGAAVLAYPSRYEGFGLPPLEAMAAGIPSVVTEAGALPEVVGDAALIVPVDDDDALAGALHQVLADPDLAAGLVARGRDRVRHFSWAATADALTSLYRRLSDR